MPVLHVTIFGTTTHIAVLLPQSTTELELGNCRQKFMEVTGQGGTHAARYQKTSNYYMKGETRNIVTGLKVMSGFGALKRCGHLPMDNRHPNLIQEAQFWGHTEELQCYKTLLLHEGAHYT